MIIAWKPRNYTVCDGRIIFVLLFSPAESDSIKIIFLVIASIAARRRKLEFGRVKLMSLSRKAVSEYAIPEVTLFDLPCCCH